LGIIATAPHPSTGNRPAWLRWLERLLWVGGALALLWVAWGWLDAKVYQAREERALEQALLRDTSTPGVTNPPVVRPVERSAGEAGGGSAPGTRGADTATREEGSDSISIAPAQRPAGGVARTGSVSPRTSATGATTTRVSAPLPLAAPTLARIVIPRVGIGVMVVSDVDHRSLRRGVGHIPGTAPLGSAGNVGIAGHRDTFFRPLKDVRVGDDIVLLTPGAITTYKVEWAEVMGAADAAPLGATDYPALTLVTCYPFYYVGSAPDRFVVRARLVESRVATAADARRLLGR